MKGTFLIILMLTPLGFADPADDYVNFIRQVQSDGSGEWDLWDLEPTGQALSYEGVGEDGSDFELWSIYSPTGAHYALDSQFVAAYAPSAAVTVNTGDPYPTLHRTRADKGFTLYVDISGLIDPAHVTADTPVAAQQVLYEHKTYEYPEGSDTLEGASVEPVMIEQLYITGNGYYPSSPGYQEFTVTNIQSNDISSVRGEEHISVTAMADFGVVESEIESITVQVWPVASGSISGLDSSAYYENVPPISIQLNDLYPSSTTWAQVYPGDSATDPNPSDIIILNDTVFLWNAALPTDRTQSLSDLDFYVTEEGLHTIQLIHQTPWGQEVLTEQEFSVDRTVEFKGNLITK